MARGGDQILLIAISHWYVAMFHYTYNGLSTGNNTFLACEIPKYPTNFSIPARKFGTDIARERSIPQAATEAIDPIPFASTRPDAMLINYIARFSVYCHRR
jgi:hypothetical protein